MQQQQQQCPHIDKIDVAALEKRFATPQLVPSCSHIGCGRQRAKHALTHFETSSDTGHGMQNAHFLCVKLVSTQIWCFGCDGEVVQESANVQRVRMAVAKLMEGPRRAGKNDKERSNTANYEHELPETRKMVPGACGLQNLGNTCYLNAAMQGLLHTPPFVQFFRECSPLLPPRSSSGTARRRLVHAVTDVIDTVHGGKLRSYSPADLLRSFVDLNPSFRGYGQQDAQEFLGHVLENLHDELRFEISSQLHSEQDLLKKLGAKEKEMTQKSGGGEGEKKKDGNGNGNGGEGAGGSGAVGGIGGGGDDEIGEEGNGAEGEEEQQQQEQGGDAAAAKVMKHYGSIVTDVFEGSLLSEVTCLVCRRTSKTAERFRILPVSIPNKKQRQKKGSSSSGSNGNGDDGLRHPPASNSGVNNNGNNNNFTVGGNNGQPPVNISPKNNNNNNKNNKNKSEKSDHHHDNIDPDDVSTVSCGPGRRKHSGLFTLVKRFLGLEKKVDVTLRDCISSFCCMEELSGTDRYRCEHCKCLNDSTKKLSILQLPEVLCVHVKRFRYDGYFGTQFGTKVSEHVEFPLQDLDMTSFIHPLARGIEGANSRYDLIAIVNHRGGLGGGHYIGYAKNAADNQWYEYDDATVTPVTPQELTRVEAYILFYQAKEAAGKKLERSRIREVVDELNRQYRVEMEENQRMMAEQQQQQQQQQQENEDMNGGGGGNRTNRNNSDNGVEAIHRPLPLSLPVMSQQPLAFLSTFWYHKFLYLNHPGPIDHHLFYCHHNNINTDPSSPSPPLFPVPLSVWESLVTTYSSTHVTPISTLSLCGECIEEKERLNKRREEEQKMIHQHDRTYVDDGEAWFIIDRNWLQKWLHFVNDGGDVPGEISNGTLLLQDGNPKPNLEKGK